MKIWEYTLGDKPSAAKFSQLPVMTLSGGAATQGRARKLRLHFCILNANIPVHSFMPMQER